MERCFRVVKRNTRILNRGISYGKGHITNANREKAFEDSDIRFSHGDFYADLFPVPVDWK